MIIMTDLRMILKSFRKYFPSDDDDDDDDR